MKLRFMGLMALAVALIAVPAAFANTYTIGCDNISGSPTFPCTGTVNTSGGNFSSTNVGVFVTSGAPAPNAGAAATLSFDTATDVISVAISGDGTLTGSFSGFTTSSGSVTTNLTLNGVVFSSLPTDIAAFIGSNGAIDSNNLQFTISNGTVAVSQMVLFPTPEPASMMLFGSGLLGIAGVLRRKLHR